MQGTVEQSYDGTAICSKDIPGAQIFASFSDGIHRVSFDKVINVMKQTGHDLPSLYKETSEGGLAAMNV